MSVVTKESNPKLYNDLFPEDEIKEILNNPKILMLSYGNYISLDDYVKLKKYITNLQEIRKEHSIMKQFIYENGLWEKLLNDDRFLDHLRSNNND